MALIDPYGGSMQAVIRRATRTRYNGNERPGTELVIFVSDQDLERLDLDEVYRVARRLTERRLALAQIELKDRCPAARRRHETIT